MVDSKKYESTKKQISKAKEKLGNQMQLTFEDIAILSEKIDELPNKEIIPSITNSGEQDTNIDKLLDEFNKVVDSLKVKLEDVIAVISEGKVPESNEREKLDTTMKLLCEKYEFVKALAVHELEEHEIPEDGSAFSVYYEALKNSKSVMLKGKIKEIEETLTRFISVKSTIVKYTTALEPLQKEARSLLLRIGMGDFIDFDKIVLEAAGPELFMRALECEDLNTDEGFDMLDSLLEKYDYPLYVTRGLSTHSYSVSENIKGMVTACKESLESTEFRKVIEEEGLVLEDSMFGILSKETNPAETKKLSASVFSNDIKKGNMKALKNIIKQLEKFMLVSPELLKVICNMPNDIASVNLEFLQKKGYLRKYKIIPGGEFYSASPRLMKSLTYKDAAKLVGVRQVQADEIEKLDIDTASSAFSRMYFVKMHINTVLIRKKSGVGQISSKSILMPEAFVDTIIDTSGPTNTTFLCGAFWTKCDEIDDFLEELLEMIKESTNITLFILAATNKDIAKILMDRIMNLVPEKILSEHVIISVAREDKFYSYKSGEEIRAEDIWK